MRTTFLAGIERSNSFLESTRSNRFGGNDSITLFLLHQSVELTLRTFILSLAGTEVKEHSISILNKHLRRCAPSVCNLFPADNEEEKALLSLLDSAYRKGRYDDSFIPDKEQLNILFKRAEELHKPADIVFSDIVRSIFV